MGGASVRRAPVSLGQHLSDQFRRGSDDHFHWAGHDYFRRACVDHANCAGATTSVGQVSITSIAPATSVSDGPASTFSAVPASVALNAERPSAAASAYFRPWVASPSSTSYACSAKSAALPASSAAPPAISAESGLRPCSDVGALLLLPPTADPKQPASSLSTALYSVKSARQFVAFSELLHRLLLEDVLWWTPGRQQSFALLKRSVAESPIT